MSDRESIRSSLGGLGKGEELGASILDSSDFSDLLRMVFFIVDSDSPFLWEIYSKPE